jgi:hypothetical protein
MNRLKLLIPFTEITLTERVAFEDTHVKYIVFVTMFNGLRVLFFVLNNIVNSKENVDVSFICISFLSFVSVMTTALNSNTLGERGHFEVFNSVCVGVLLFVIGKAQFMYHVSNNVFLAALLMVSLSGFMATLSKMIYHGRMSGECIWIIAAFNMFHDRLIMTLWMQMFVCTSLAALLLSITNHPPIENVVILLFISQYLMIAQVLQYYERD